MKHILALDLGTTNVRAVLFDEAMRPVSTDEMEINVFYPKSGWVEQDPVEMITKQLQVAKRVVDKSGVAEASIAGIGVTNQRETTILWNRDTGRPIGNAIVWQDRRTATICEKVSKTGHAQLIYNSTGLILDPYFSASKINWLMRNTPGLQEAAKAGKIAFGTVDSWLIWNLTQGKVHYTDPTNASRTMLFNIKTLAWDDELLNIWDVPREILPTVKPSTGFFGETSLISSKNIPISGVMGDQQAAFFGQRCFQRGSTKCTYGTGCFTLINTGDEANTTSSGLLTTIAFSDGISTEYALEASIFMGGSTVQWLRDGLGIIDRSEEIEELAEKVEDANGVVLVPAFTGLGAPHWDPHARGIIIGLTRDTNKNHIARSVLDAIAWQVNDVIDLMSETAEIEIDFIRVDGGAVENNLLMQIQADYLQRPVYRSAHKETTALGAAMVSSLGIKLHKNKQEIPVIASEPKIFKPKITQAMKESAQSTWYRAVKRSLSWAID